jgi:tetratricopeptide (TPR) repeat protein
MHHAPTVTFLITSREPLKLYGETIFHLQMLSLQEACQLFYERVRTVQPDFQRTEAVDAKVKSICQRLDGLPLAIELASTRARTMSMDEILAGLNHCLDLLATDLRNMPRRQRALFSAIEWSYSLLTPEQALLFRRLAVFRGGWTRDVIPFIAPNNRELDNLVDKNLIRRVFSGTHRYNMLETIREYAYHQLEKTDELAIAQDAMAQWMLHFSEDAMSQIQTKNHSHVIKQVREEDENIRIVLDYLATQPDQLVTYARIVGALGWIWNFLGICTMPFQHAKRIIAQADKLPESVRANVLVSGGHSAHEMGQCDLAETWQREALRIYQELGDEANIYYTEFFLSGRMTDKGTSVENLSVLRQKALERNDLFLLSLVNINLGATLLDRRQITQSIVMLEEGMNICEEMGFVLLLPIYYLNIADTYSANGEVEKAFKFLERAYAISQAENYIFTCIISLMELCDLCYRIGRFGDIESYVNEAEQLTKQLPLPMLSVRVHFWRAVVASFTDNMAQFYGAYKHIFRYIHISDVNMSFYIMNSIFYLILMMVKRRKSLEKCALLVSGIDAYREKINITYSDMQQNWRDAILEAFAEVHHPYQEQGKLLSIEDVLRESENLLEQLIL